MPLREETQVPEHRPRRRSWRAGLLFGACILLALLAVLVAVPFFRPVDVQVGRTCVIVLTGPDEPRQSWAPRFIFQRLPVSGLGNSEFRLHDGASYRTEGTIEIRGVGGCGRAYGIVWFPGRRAR